uniref:Uncharacterized protein n=1 Tax=Anguilla anguilla TaxID=7936 RepID=A0A0E9SLJ0_ANGAN
MCSLEKMLAYSPLYGSTPETCFSRGMSRVWNWCGDGATALTALSSWTAQATSWKV